MKNRIKLILSGSGTLFYYHFGALKKLSEVYDIEEIVCVSGGSIIGSLYCSGYSINNIEKILLDIDLSKLIDFNLNPFNGFGLIKGNKIENKLKEYLNTNINNVVIPLTVIISDLDNFEPVYISSKNYTYFKLYRLIRASISIPILFNYFSISDKKYIDGGVTNNFPIDYFSEDENVIGIKINNNFSEDQKQTKFVDKIKYFIKGKLGFYYILRIIDLLIKSNENEHIEDIKKAKIIYIDSDRSNTEFNFNTLDKLDMINEGYIKTEEFIFNDNSR